MKAILTILLILPLMIVYSQKGNNTRLSAEFPLSDLIRNSSFVHEGKMYLFSNNNEYQQNTTVINLNEGTSSSFEQKKLEIDNYVVALIENKKFFHGDYLYDFVKVINKKKMGNQAYAVLKRNVNSIDKIEKVLWFENFTPAMNGYVYNNVKISFYPGKSCFYVVRKATVGKDGEKNYIAKYNFDLEEEWKKDLSFTNQKDVDLDFVSVNDNDDLLISLKYTGDTKGKISIKSTVTVKSSGFIFYILDKDGNELVISPEIDQQILIQHYHLRYYPEKKEVVGLFLSTNLEKDHTTSGNGYAYMKWDSEGSILVSNSRFFSVKDFQSSELDDFFKLSKKNYDEFSKKNGELKSLRLSKDFFTIELTDNQEAFFGSKYYRVYVSDVKSVPVSSVIDCQLLYRVNNNGELEWLNLIPGMEGNYFQSEDNIYLFKSDLSENFSEGGEHSFSFNKGNSIVSVRKINAKTGETELFEPISNKFVNDFVINYSEILFENNQFFIECKNEKKKIRKILTYGL